MQAVRCGTYRCLLGMQAVSGGHMMVLLVTGKHSTWTAGFTCIWVAWLIHLGCLTLYQCHHLNTESAFGLAM